MLAQEGISGSWLDRGWALLANRTRVTRPDAVYPVVIEIKETSKPVCSEPSLLQSAVEKFLKYCQGLKTTMFYLRRKSEKARLWRGELSCGKVASECTRLLCWQRPLRLDLRFLTQLARCPKLFSFFPRAVPQEEKILNTAVPAENLELGGKERLHLPHFECIVSRTDRIWHGLIAAKWIAWDWDQRLRADNLKQSSYCPLINLWSVFEKFNSERALFIWKHMRDLLEVRSEVLLLGTRGIIFCAFLQSAEWHQTLLRKMRSSKRKASRRWRGCGLEGSVQGADEAAVFYERA